MPELPEVEITRQKITALLVGRTISSVRTTKPSYFFLTHPAKLKRALTGRRLVGLQRHGKYLILSTETGVRLLLHLGMTGQLFGAEAISRRLLLKRAGVHRPFASFSPDQHTHLQLGFEDGPPHVYFRDTRKFGKCALLLPGEAEPRLLKLGPDALSIDCQNLHRRLTSRKASIKLALLDQSVLAGVGNIYADEALFVAGILPTRSANTLDRLACAALARSVRKTLKRAISRGGSSVSDYVQPDGSDGSYQKQCWVYGRAGQPCLRCGTVIARTVIAQRSTHYCNRCQR